jgi:hypothetical protein
MSQIENETEGSGFETVSDIQRKSPAVLDSIKENDFHGAWEKRWNRCVCSQGNYFEEYGSQNEVKPAFFYLVRELSDTPRTYINKYIHT